MVKVYLSSSIQHENVWVDIYGSDVICFEEAILTEDQFRFIDIFRGED